MDRKRRKIMATTTLGCRHGIAQPDVAPQNALRRYPAKTRPAGRKTGRRGETKHRVRCPIAGKPGSSSRLTIGPYQLRAASKTPVAAGKNRELAKFARHNRHAGAAGTQSITARPPSVPKKNPRLSPRACIAGCIWRRTVQAPNAIRTCSAPADTRCRPSDHLRWNHIHSSCRRRRGDPD